jgi:chemotaxis protein methyltransferase CheR
VSQLAPRRDSRADEFAAFCEGVQRLSNVDLRQYKRAQMERRIRTFSQRRGKPDLLDYLALLAADPGELDLLLDRVTINVSQLWRNPLQWQTLAEQAIPELARHGPIRAWSAGCSYGAEVFTMAAICREVAPDAAVSVRGTDIDERMIARARRGHFSSADVRTVPAGSLGRWFERLGEGWRACDELMALVRFEVENLLDCEPARGAYDLIACRNLVIYFTEETRAAVHRKLACALRPGGWLIVGSAERIPDARAHGLDLVYPFIYRKA